MFEPLAVFWWYQEKEKLRWRFTIEEVKQKVAATFLIKKIKKKQQPNHTNDGKRAEIYNRAIPGQWIYSSQILYFSS